jgi:hypothetical protein
MEAAKVSYIALVDERLKDLVDGGKRAFWNDIWKTLISRSEHEVQGKESLLHLGCKEAVRSNAEEYLQRWAQHLVTLRKNFAQDTGWKGKTEGNRWPGLIAQGVVAAACMAVRVQSFKEDTMIWGWKASKYLQTQEEDSPADLSALGEKFMRAWSGFRGGLAELVDEAFQLLKAESPKTSFAQVHDLVRGFIGYPRVHVPSTSDVRQPRSYRCPVLLVKKRSGKAEEGVVATLALELIDGGCQELYAAPFSFAFAERKEDFEGGKARCHQHLRLVGADVGR